jgi:hypothetical protein
MRAQWRSCRLEFAGFAYTVLNAADLQAESSRVGGLRELKLSHAIVHAAIINRLRSSSDYDPCWGDATQHFRSRTVFHGDDWSKECAGWRGWSRLRPALRTLASALNSPRRS